MHIKSTKKPSAQVGLWLQDEQLEVVVCAPPQASDKKLFKNGLLFFRLPMAQISQLPAQLKSQLKGRPYRLISSLLPHQIWQKNLILPHSLNAQEAEQQCRFTLQNELPVPLDDVWFDYCTKPLKQGLRLEIFAIKKSLAQQHLAQFMPLQLDVLDSAAKALQRAFAFELGKPLETNSLLIYDEGEQLLLVGENAQQSYASSFSHDEKTFENYPALLEQFCQRYDFKPSKIYCAGLSNPPADWQIIESEYPLIALGNALWNDFKCEENSNV